jgi:hypothetical protein
MDPPSLGQFGRYLNHFELDGPNTRRQSRAGGNLANLPQIVVLLGSPPHLLTRMRTTCWRVGARLGDEDQKENAHPSYTERGCG